MVNTPPPTVQTVTPRNYNLPSYDLQTTDVTVDINKVREFNGRSGNGWAAFAIAYLDINVDGHDDIFLVPVDGDDKRNDVEMYVYKNGGYFLDNSYFNVTPSLINGRKAITGDFNGDKRPDIFIAGHGYDKPPFPGEYTQMLLSNSNGKYDIKTFQDKVGFYHSATSGDIDKDGDLDIFVLDKVNAYFLINDGKGNFTYSTTQIDIYNLNGQYTCELMDVNKDGYLDLVMGGHEFDSMNTTRIYWGNSTYKYTDKTDIPRVNGYGVVVDIDMFDIDGDGTNEITINRAGGNTYDDTFYSGWYIQIVKVDNKQVTDVTNQYIENNSFRNGPHNWLIWVRFQDYDNNGKVDLFSTICGEYGFVRWELRDKKLIRVI
jgi:hypothetical protein